MSPSTLASGLLGQPGDAGGDERPEEEADQLVAIEIGLAPPLQRDFRELAVQFDDREELVEAVEYLLPERLQERGMVRAPGQGQHPDPDGGQQERPAEREEISIADPVADASHQQ